MAKTEPGSQPEIVVQMGHSVGIHWVMLSPRVPWSVLGFPSREGSGRIAASGANDGTAKLWDPVTGREVRSLQMGQGSSVGGIAFSPDGRRIAAAGETLTRVWEVGTGRAVATHKGGPEHAEAVAFSLDGRLVAVGDDGGAAVWDLETPGSSRSIPVPARRVAFGPGGMLALAGIDRTTGGRAKITIWDTRQNRMQEQFASPQLWVESMAFAPDGALYILSSPRSRCDPGNCGTITVRAPGKPPRSLAAPPFLLTGGQFCAEGRRLAGGDNGRVVLWDVEAQRALWETAGTDHFAESAACADDEAIVATAGMGEVRLWTDLAGTPPRILLPEAASIDRIVTSADGGALLLMGRGSQGGNPQSYSVLRWKLGTLAPPRARLQLQYPVAFAPDLSWWVSGDQTSLTAKVFQDGMAPIDTGLSIYKTFAGTDRDGARIAFATDGVVVSFRSPSMRQEGRLDTGLRNHTPVALSYSSDGRLLAGSLGDGAVGLWRVPQVTAVCRLGEPKGPASVVWAIAFSPDSRFVATGGNERDITVWRTADCTAAQVLRGHTGAMEGLAYSTDGRTLASVAADGSVRMWDLRTGVGRVIANTGWIVNHVAFAAADRVLVTAGWENTAKLWDTTSGELLATMILAPGSEDWLVVTPEGYFDGTARAADLIGWRAPGTNEVTPLSRYYVDFLRPGLLGELMEGGRPKPEVDIAASLGIPSLRTMLAGAGAQARLDTSREPARICLSSAPGVPLELTPGDVARPIKHRGVSVDPTDAACPFQIDLSDVAARQVQRLASVTNAAPTLPPWEGKVEATKSGRLRILTVAIDSYGDKATYPDLPYPRRSAASLREAFTAAAKGLFREVVAAPPLEDSAATTDATIAALRRLANEAASDDVVVVYLAGHGQLDLGDEMFHFATAESGKDGSKGLSTAALSDALRAFRARRIILIVDACQSGGSIEALQRVARRRADLAAAKGGEGPIGIYLLAAASPLSYAMGAKESALSVALQEALVAKDEGELGVRALLSNVEQSLPLVSQRVLKLDYKQTPLVVNVGADFPIAAARTRSPHSSPR